MIKILAACGAVLTQVTKLKVLLKKNFQTVVMTFTVMPSW